MAKNMTTREYYTSIQNLGDDAKVSSEGIADLRSGGVTASDAEIHTAFQQFVAKVKSQSFQEFDKAMTMARKQKKTKNRLVVDSGESLRAGWPSGGCWGGPGNVGIGDAIWGSIGYLF
jgi:hypothetical protein